MARRNGSEGNPQVVDISALVDGLEEAAGPEIGTVPEVGALPEVGPAPEPVASRAEPSEQEQALLARLKELENQLAVERGRKDPELELETPPNDGETIVIHVVENGFTALGQVWYRGQELEFDPAGRAYQDTRDKLGRSWLDLDDNAQIDRYGEVKFRRGPWSGRSYDAAAGAPLDFPLKPIRDGDSPVLPPTQDELHAAAKREQSRGRAVPRLTVR